MGLAIPSAGTSLWLAEILTLGSAGHPRALSCSSAGFPSRSSPWSRRCLLEEAQEGWSQQRAFPKVSLGTGCGNQECLTFSH